MSAQGGRILKRWIIGSVALIVLVGLPLGLLWWIKASEVRQWESMQRQLSELARQSNHGDGTRPVLRGDPQPGNGWDDYESEIISISPLSKLFPARELLDAGQNADRQKARALTSQFEAALKALQQGASRARAHRSRGWDRDQVFRVNVWPMGGLAILHSRLLCEEGRTREAADFLLDTGQFGMDVARNGNSAEASTGIYVLSAALDELRRLIDVGRLRREEIVEVDRQLELLDQNYPSAAERHVVSAAATGLLFLEKDNLQSILENYGIKPQKLSTWRFGFSERLMIVDACATGIFAARRLAEAETKVWAEAREIQRSVNLDYSKDGNGLVRLLYTPMDGPEKPIVRDAFREGRTHLRLLRIAAHYAATGEILSLEDPFGLKLRTSETGISLTVWSVGGDGADDNGVGEWKPGKGKDIVLTIKR